MEQKQSNFLVTLLSNLLIISCLIAGFFAYQTQKLVKELQGVRSNSTAVQTPAPTSTPDPTTDWKTYINDKYGYSMKYPEKSVLNEVSDNNYLSFVSFEGSNIQPLSVYVSSLKLNEEAKKIRSQTEGHLNAKLVKNESIIFSSFPAVKLEYLSTDEKKIKTINFIVNNGKYTYVINTQPDSFDKILSTFAFTNNQNSVITSQKAIEIVTALPEVKEFFNKNLNAKSSLDESQSNNKVWMIHVYESFTDHNATFNWYKVDKITGEVVKQIFTSPQP